MNYFAFPFFIRTFAPQQQTTNKKTMKRHIMLSAFCLCCVATQAQKALRYTTEFYAYKHFSHFVAPGTRMVAYAGREHAKTPVVVFRTGKGYVVTAGNLTDEAVTCNVQLEGKYLNMNLPAHSFSTWGF